MQTFLQEAAQRLYERYGSDISSLHIVLPSRRARLFFSDALAAIIDKPIWQPRYLSMDDIMTKYSSLQVGEKIRLITELYRIYAEYHPSETFDKFYFWGEVLLSDFDLIDKYMIDADMLFRNLYDLKELESDLSYLSDEMRELIHSFWSNFAPEATLSLEKHKFLSVWLSLAPIYHRFRERIASLGIAYTGMIYRSAAERIERDGVQEQTHYIFIGFNALSECERKVLRALDRGGACDFIWDSDTYYTANREQEAGRFLCENIREFKAKDEITDDNFLAIKKQLHSISCVSNVVQCKHVNTLLREISPSLTFDKQTAIVLTDESLLMPLLHSLPEEVSSNVNVTMGYPLRQTTAYSLIERLIELQKRCRTGVETTFYHADVMGILAHPYISEILSERTTALCDKIVKGRYMRVSESFFNDEPMLKEIFSAADRSSSLANYLLNTLQCIASMGSQEQSDERTRKMSYLSLIANSITDLDNVLKDCQIDISTTIYTSLLRRHLQTVRIPFSGEPLQGLQIMGILETRNIDFKNVIILSMNDDNFPGKIGSSTSFIPYNLRAAYGIPTPEHHESVYAYYFYRLLQRAERVDMLYCSHADLKSNGERSRYIYQLEYESPYRVAHTNVGVDVALEHTSRSVVKDERVAEELNKYIGSATAPAQKTLSPSAFAQYIACPMQFYLSKIAHIKPSDTLSEDVDSSMLGTILHEAMYALYKPLKGIANPSLELQRLLKSDEIEKAVIKAINKVYLNLDSTSYEEYTGHLMLVKNIVTKYIRQGIIPFDESHNDFTVVECEETISVPFALSDGREVSIGGVADRIDSLDDGRLRVVDYKTGSASDKMKVGQMVSLFDSEMKHRYVFQTMLYSMVLHHRLGREVTPALYFARDLNKHLRRDEYSPYPTLNGEEFDYTRCGEEFETLLRDKLEELFDLSRKFECCAADSNHSPCQYCDYKSICKR